MSDFPTRFRRLALPGALLLAGLSATAQAARPFSTDDMLALQRVGAPVASKDGKLIAFQVATPDLAANKSRTDLYLHAVNGKDAPRRLTSHEASDHSPEWSADGQHIYFLSSRSGSSQIWRIAVAGGEAEQVSRYPLDVQAFRLSPKNDRVAVAFEVFPDCATLQCTADRDGEKKAGSGMHFDRLFVRHWDSWKDGHMNRVFADELKDGKTADKAVALSVLDGDAPSKPFGGSEDFVFSNDGSKLVFVARVRGVSEPWSTNTDLYEVPVSGSALTDVKPVNLTPDNKGYDNTPVFSPDGKQLAWLSMARPDFEADKLRILIRDLASGATRELSKDVDRSFGAIQWSADGKTLYATADDVGNHALFAFDVASGKHKRLIDKGSVGAYTQAGKDLVLQFDNLKNPVELYRLPASGGSKVKLTGFNDARLAEMKFGDYEQFSFKGANDETVYGYIVKPADYVEGRKYPIALLVHGGPQGSFGDHFHYRWNPQSYAGRGYAAIMIDFHGSTGYGQAFTDSISGDWGGKPLEDLKKGMAAALAKYSFLDGSRACALGASYGGYMMNWIAGNWSDGFKCIVNHAGVFDQRAMGYTTEELWFTEWENGGTPFAKPENYEKFNPVNYVNNWKTPTLVTQGQKDFRIPYVQSIAAFTALQRRGIPSELLMFPDENHWILKLQNSKQWHEQVLNWLDRWTQPESKQ